MKLSSVLSGMDRLIMQVCFFFLVFVNGSFLKTIVNKKTPENQGEAQQEVKMLSLRHHCCASSEAQASLGRGVADATHLSSLDRLARRRNPCRHACECRVQLPGSSG